MQNTELKVIVGDITTLDVDVIVNAANPQLRAGGGVCGAIHAAAGPDLERECLSLYPDGIQPGQAVATAGFRAKAKWIVHAVAPISNRVDLTGMDLLLNAYANAIRTADELGAKSIALPSLGTGIYGWKISDVGARVMIDAIRIPARQSINLEQVILCCFAEADADSYLSSLGEDSMDWKRA